MQITNDIDEMMPIWLPLSPPNSEFELKMEDDYLDLMYEPEHMSEARLPQVTHEVRRPPLAEKPKQNQTLNDILSKEKDSVYDAVAKCLQMPKQEPAAASPAYTENSFSMDDSSQEPKIEPLLHMENQQPSGLAMNQMHMMHQQHQMMQQQQQRQRKRRNNNSSNDLGGLSTSSSRGGGDRVGGGTSGIPPNRTQPDTSVVRRATTPPPAIREEPDYDGAEWNIVEDYALLQAVQQELALGHTVERNTHFPGLQLNWDYVALAVNKQTRFYRSPRQCSIRYQMFVRPKELNQLVASDPITKRNIKVELSTTELAHLRRGRITTESQYAYDYGTLTDKKHLNRFKAVKMASQKRTLSFWRGPKGLEARQLKSLSNGLPANHMNKLRELEVIPGLIRDAEEVLTLPEDKIAELEAQKKAMQIRNMLMKSQTPRPESRFHTLVERPYTVPINTELKPAPPRRDMVIAVPPLQLQPTVNQQPIIVHQPAASLAPSTSSAGGQSMHNSASHPNLQGGGMQGDNRGDNNRGDNRGGLGGMHLNQGASQVHHGGGGGGLGGNHAPAHLLNVNNHHGHQLPPIGTIMQNQNQNQQNHNQNQQPTIPIRQISQHGGGGLDSQGPPPPHPQPTIQRRTASVSNVQFLNQQQQGGGTGYVVMSGDGPGGSQGPPPSSQQAQRVQYVPQGGGRGTYANTVVMQRGGHRVVQRPPGTLPNGGRVYIDHQRQYPANVVPVRVMPAGQGGQAHRVMPTGTRRAPPLPGTVAAMVLPNRNNPGGPQIRTMQRTTNNYPGQQQRINVMVQPQNMRAGGPGGGSGGMMGGPGPMRRQIVRPLQRIDNSGPPVAQVVVAPPQGLQTGGGGGGGPPMLHVNRPLHLSSQAAQQAPPPGPSQGPPPSHQAPMGGGGPSGGGPGPSGPSGGDGPSTTSSKL
ncbi:hypothetical protein CAEBREN_11121 [Caenorhabditis brenneri]|uniref:Myb-like domain-containing protein n=1 Tax=Caenorhabditis brenneri TaxID=135651 RepID=G0NSA4_CAEBE|nr:hypothetical protein CAEBREN_11121 [Caenorhabditis brenneri]